MQNIFFGAICQNKNLRVDFAIFFAESAPFFNSFLMLSQDLLTKGNTSCYDV